MTMVIFLVFSAVQFSRSVVSNSLQPHRMQHARLPRPSPTPRACSNSCPSHWWCHSNHLILCRPLLLPPSIFPSIRVFCNELALHIRWSKFWGFSSCNEYSGLISFMIDWFDPAVQGTIKSILQNHSSKALIVWCSVFSWSNSHYWKNRSFNYMDLHRQSNVSAF